MTIIPESFSKLSFSFLLDIQKNLWEKLFLKSVCDFMKAKKLFSSIWDWALQLIKAFHNLLW